MFKRFKSLALVISALLAVVGLPLVLASPAVADTAPAAGTPATVSADALPTWQINGVAWNQVMVGNTVYVAGSFTAARPPGVAAGGAGEVSANNIFAYDVTTGNRVASFSHSLNGQALGITKSPDGSVIYVVGDFTTVDGATRNHVAAFNTATGALTSFAPSVNGSVRTVATNGSTLWFGGNFSKVNNVARTRLGAVATASPTVTLPWAPTADDNIVSAMVVSPDQSRVIVGGMFTTLNGQPASGMGSLNATTGATMPWAINQQIQDGGTKSSITSLAVDGNNVYGSGYAFGSGNFEGSFAADPNTGNPVFINDCHGDTYGVFPIGPVLYTVSHAHDCRWIGSFPQTDSNWAINQRKALAFTIAPKSTDIGPDNYGWNFAGQPASALLHWFPELQFGTYTAAGQAAWSVTGNDKYVALGGEFPKINNTAQQGLARFAVSTAATNKRGPVKVSLAASPNAPVTAPSAISVQPGTARIAWQAAVDPDNTTLTYTLSRGGSTIYTKQQDSNFWTYPMMGFKDTGLTPGKSYTYTVRATDPFGNVTVLGQPTVTVSAGAVSAYANDVSNDGASAFWRLGESSGTTAYDSIGFNDATSGTGVTEGAAGAIGGDANTADTFDGSTNGTVISPAMTATSDFTTEAWIKTTTTSGGKIIGYGSANSGDSSSYDRHVYMDNAGHIIFGVYPGDVRTISSGSKTYNDGQFHHIVAEQSASKGMALFIDGKKVASDASTTSAQGYAGFWRIGGDNLGGWPYDHSSNYFNGTIDDVAVYPSALTLSQVQQHYGDSGRTVATTPAPTDTYGKAVFNSAPDVYWRLGESTGSTAVDSSGNAADGVYSGGVTLGRPAGVVGTADTSAAFNGSDGTVGSAVGIAGPSTYSEELWFKTDTVHGGKLIGFGDRQSGTSSNYDRHVYMENSGQLTFGVWTGFTNTITSASSYNDNTWHYLVAEQGSDGMKMYVDGQLVGTNPQTQQQPYNGYWRVGGDSDWGGDSPFFNGTIDEVALYSNVLDAATVTAHYKAGGGTVGNLKPQAAFTSTTANKVASFDATGSSDPDGTIASYSWNFGDSTAAGSGATPQHTYAAAGTYQVTLTVTDDQGATDTVTHPVTIAGAAPTASFAHTESYLKTTVDGSASSDPDGTVASYDWDWGDSSAHGAGQTASHTYGAAGTYQVTLTVTDADGLTGTTTRTVTVVANTKPTAVFTSNADERTLSVDGSASTDSDGSVASYAWSWGDGTTNGSGQTTSHTYTAVGTYTVTLTVTDDQGLTDTVSHDVTITSNQAPTAAFTSTVSGLSVSADGNGSSDPDGSVASYAWSWGDSTASSGATANHTYAAGGTYTVKLTVTDNKGATDTVSHDVTVTAPVNPVLAADAFGRSVASGWGTADTGGTWAPKSGYTSNFSVANGVGTAKMVKAGNSPQILLNGVSSAATDSTVSMSVRATTTGGGTYGTLIGREVSDGGGYRATLIIKPTGVVQLNVVRRNAAGTETSVVPASTVPGLTLAAGEQVKLRLVVSGTSPTTVKARVWKASAAEPSTWLVNTTDSTAGIQAAGTVGLMAYLSGSSTDVPAYLDFDDLLVKPAN